MKGIPQINLILNKLNKKWFTFNDLIIEVENLYLKSWIKHSIKFFFFLFVLMVFIKVTSIDQLINWIFFIKGTSLLVFVWFIKANFIDITWVNFFMIFFNVCENIFFVYYWNKNLTCSLQRLNNFSMRQLIFFEQGLQLIFDKLCFPMFFEEN